MTTWATIPYRDQGDLTCNLLRQLDEQDGLEGVILCDHDSGPDTVAAVEAVIGQLESITVSYHRFGAEATLTDLWNAAADTAIGREVISLAFLNNDITIGPGFIAHLERALWADPALWAVCPDWHRPVAQGTAPGRVRYVTGVQRHGGMCGWAFMVKVGAWTVGGLPRFDPRCRFWGADDDLAFAIEHAGYKVGLCEGVPITHLGSQTLITRPELIPICHEDLEYVKRKWGR